MDKRASHNFITVWTVTVSSFILFSLIQACIKYKDQYSWLEINITKAWSRPCGPHTTWGSTGGMPAEGCRNQSRESTLVFFFRACFISQTIEFQYGMLTWLYFTPDTVRSLSFTFSIHSHNSALFQPTFLWSHKTPDNSASHFQLSSSNSALFHYKCHSAVFITSHLDNQSALLLIMLEHSATFHVTQNHLALIYVTHHSSPLFPSPTDNVQPTVHVNWKTIKNIYIFSTGM